MDLVPPEGAPAAFFRHWGPFEPIWACLSPFEMWLLIWCRRRYPLRHWFSIVAYLRCGCWIDAGGGIPCGIGSAFWLIWDESANQVPEEVYLAALVRHCGLFEIWLLIWCRRRYLLRHWFSIVAYLRFGCWSGAEGGISCGTKAAISSGSNMRWIIWIFFLPLPPSLFSDCLI